MICRHCQTWKGQPDRRGLCCQCHAKPAIRRRYPADAFHRPDLVERHEETEADVEALVAEQMANLPDWWDRCMPNGRKGG